jgi:hypothetical protein
VTPNITLTLINENFIFTMVNKRHPSKDIQGAIDYAVKKGWRIVDAGKSSHAFCRLYCMEDSRDGCKFQYGVLQGISRPMLDKSEK